MDVDPVLLVAVVEGELVLVDEVEGVLVALESGVVLDPAEVLVLGLPAEEATAA